MNEKEHIENKIQNEVSKLNTIDMENQTKESNLNSESDKHDEEKNENPASNDEGDNINDSQLDELFEDFLKDVESISSNQNIAKETNKLKKEDAEKEINRILSNKNSSPFEILGIVIRARQ